MSIDDMIEILETLKLNHLVAAEATFELDPTPKSKDNFDKLLSEVMKTDRSIPHKH